jgi:hypothetical protein
MTAGKPRKRLSELTQKDVDAMAAELEAKKEAEAAARRLRVERASALAAWRDAGGDDVSFEKEYPKIRDEARRRRVLEKTGQVEAAARARVRQSL